MLPALTVMTCPAFSSNSPDWVSLTSFSSMQVRLPTMPFGVMFSWWLLRSVRPSALVLASLPLALPSTTSSTSASSSMNRLMRSRPPSFTVLRPCLYLPSGSRMIAPS